MSSEDSFCRDHRNRRLQILCSDCADYLTGAPQPTYILIRDVRIQYFQILSRMLSFFVSYPSPYPTLSETSFESRTKIVNCKKFHVKVEIQLQKKSKILKSGFLKSKFTLISDSNQQNYNRITLPQITSLQFSFPRFKWRINFYQTMPHGQYKLTG